MMNTNHDKYKFIYKIPYKYSSEQMEGFNISAFIVNSEAYPYINCENTITYIQKVFPKDVISDKYFYEEIDDENGYFYCNSLKGVYLYKSTFQMPEDGFSMNDNDELFLDLNHLINNINYLNADLLALQTAVMRNTASAKDHLFVDICRISADGKYLEIDMSCDPNYTYRSFGFYDYLDDMSSNKPTDLMDCLDTDVNGDYTNRQLLRINLDKLNGKSMYYIIVEIWLKEYNIDGTHNDPKSVVDSIELFTNAVSDVTNVYFYLLPRLIQLTKPCDPCDTQISPEIQRAFLVLWSHLEAIRLERWKEAEMFYTLIKNNFQNCLGDFELKQKSCNCHGQKQSNFDYRR